MNCWGGGAAKAVSSREADDGLSPKSTFFTTVITGQQGAIAELRQRVESLEARRAGGQDAGA